MTSHLPAPTQDNMMNVIMFQYHVTTQSTIQYEKVTSHIYSQFYTLCSDHPLDHKTLQCDQLFYHTSTTTASLSLSLSPPMDTSEVCVEILHVAKGVVCLSGTPAPCRRMDLSSQGWLHRCLHAPAYSS